MENKLITKLLNLILKDLSSIQIDRDNTIYVGSTINETKIFLKSNEIQHWGLSPIIANATEICLRISTHPKQIEVIRVQEVIDQVTNILETLQRILVS